MKTKIFLLSYLILQIAISINISAQINSTDTIFYKNWLNPLNMILEDYDCDSILLSTNNGMIIKDSCEFKYQPVKEGFGRIFVYKKTSNDTMLIAKKSVKVIDYPTPRANIFGREINEIPKNHLLAILGIAIYWDDKDIDGTESVKSYKVIISRGDSILFINQEQSNFFSEKTKEKFKILRKGDMVFFINIIVVSPEEKEIETNPIAVSITDD